MTHRIVIINSLRAALAEPGVRECWSTDQCTKVDAILACEIWTDEQFRYVQRRLAQAYCTGD